MLRPLCLSGLLAMSAGCSSTLGEYQCVTSIDCVGDSAGRCEPSGHCSFADDSCEGGFRFGEASGSESQSCVAQEPVPIDAALPEPDANTTPQSAWAQRQRLTFNNLAHAENLVDFPVLVVLTPERVDYARIQAGAQDLRFTDRTGDVQLPFEIEVWDPSGTSYIWVKAPKIDASSDADYIYIYYDNPMAAAAQTQQDVWTNGYEAVYHMGEEGDVFANSVGAQLQANNGGTTAVAGAVGGGRHFDGEAAHIKLNNGDPVDLLRAAPGMTATAWLRPEDLGSQQAFISVGTGDTPCTNKSRLATLVANSPADEIVMAARSIDSDPLTLRTTPNANLVENDWVLVSTVVDVDFLHDEAAARPYGRVSFVVNNSLQTITQNLRMAEPATDVTQATCATIGAQEDLSADFFAGGMDEIRISNVDRSTIWLQAQYQSMSDADFVRFGLAEDVDEPFEN